MRRPAPLMVLAAVLVPVLGGAPAAGSSCETLSAQLAVLDRQGGGNGFAAAAARQRAELGRAAGLAARCSLIASPACADLPRRLGEMRGNLARLDAAARRSAGGDASAGRRARLLAAMRQQGCGRTRAALAAAPAPAGGLLAFLGLVPSSPVPEIITRGPPPMMAREGPAERALRRRIEAPDPEPSDHQYGFGRGPFRTLCVRSCDGYFWPVSYSVPRAAFERDEAVCRAACPNLEVALYAHRNPGGTSADAISMWGRPYSELPTANLFRTRFDPACQCRPASPEGEEPIRAGFTPVPPQPRALPPRSIQVPLVISTGRDQMIDRETGSEGLRGVHPGRAGAATPDGREAAPRPAPARSAAGAP